MKRSQLDFVHRLFFLEASHGERARLMRNRRDSVRMATLSIATPERINWVPICLMTRRCGATKFSAARRSAHDEKGVQEEGKVVSTNLF